MDGKHIQLSRSSDGVKGPFEIRSLPARGGGCEHEVLVAEGHYRCPHCRRAGIGEKHATARRMR
jgi:hypothetical protein